MCWVEPLEEKDFNKEGGGNDRVGIWDYAEVSPEARVREQQWPDSVPLIRYFRGSGMSKHNLIPPFASLQKAIKASTFVMCLCFSFKIKSEKTRRTQLPFALMTFQGFELSGKDLHSDS